MRAPRPGSSAGLRRRFPTGPLLTVLLAVCLAGCGGGAPFKIVPVSGKVMYSDRSLIRADRIVVTFVPQGVEAAGKDAAAPATGDVNVTDGSFAGLTTQKHHDGAIVGRHKVLVQAFKTGPAGVGEPIAAVPRKYAKAATTPLEFEVPSGGKDDCEFLIDKTP